MGSLPLHEPGLGVFVISFNVSSCCHGEQLKVPDAIWWGLISMEVSTEAAVKSTDMTQTKTKEGERRPGSAAEVIKNSHRQPVKMEYFQSEQFRRWLYNVLFIWRVKLIFGKRKMQNSVHVRLFLFWVLANSSGRYRHSNSHIHGNGPDCECTSSQSCFWTGRNQIWGAPLISASMFEVENQTNKIRSINVLLL